MLGDFVLKPLAAGFGVAVVIEKTDATRAQLVFKLLEGGSDFLTAGPLQSFDGEAFLLQRPSQQRRKFIIAPAINEQCPLPEQPEKAIISHLDGRPAEAGFNQRRQQQKQ